MSRILAEIPCYLRCQLRQNICGLLNDLIDRVQGKIAAGLTKTLQRFAVRPVGRTIQRERHAVLRQIGHRADEIIDRRKTCSTSYIFIDDTEVFQMCVTIAKCTIEDEQLE